MVLFNNHKMFSEIFDLSQNWSNYSITDSMRSEKKNYYLANALLELESNGDSKFYSSAMGKVFKNDIAKTTPVATASKIKAYLKEDNWEAAQNLYSFYQNRDSIIQEQRNNFYYEIYNKSFDPEKSGRRTFFHPDILKEREARIAAEIEEAGKISPIERERVASKYKLIGDYFAEMPLEYLEFKDKYHKLKERTQLLAQ